nr:DUF4859 domain-containing protein [uncultured Draconibacterium sp.]
MKKIHILLILALVITAGLFSCGDNEEFSNMHVLTGDEIAEIARQDSIEEAQKNKINADLILEYSMNITISKTTYDGDIVEIELDKIAEAFGITEEELLAGIGGESGAPEIKGFAIAGTTHADITGASNTNAPWGHWWDGNGDLTGWGDDAMVFAEFYPENGYFNVGQFPKHLEDGQQIKFIEGLKYNEVRVAVVITVNAVSAPAYVDPETAPEGDPEAITIEVELSKTYSDDYNNVTFDVKDTLRNAFKMTTYQIHSAIQDGSFKLYQGEVTEEDPTYTADAPGYWLNIDGTAVGWDEGFVWTSIGHSETELFLYGGNHPDNAVAGDTITTKYIATCNGGSVTINLTFKVE